MKIRNANKKSILNDLPKPPKVGEIVEGKVIGSGRSSLYLDLGIFGIGIVYGKEFYRAKDKLRDVKTGDTIFAKIVDLENKEGFVELSVAQAGKELSWEKLKKLKEEGKTLKIKILGANKGGLLTKIFGIPGFLPVSQLIPEHYPKVDTPDPAKIVKELQKFINKEMEVKILDFDQKEEKLILSERAVLIEKLKEILKKYKVGDVVEGEITAILDFGAFMKFGKEKLEGLIHISELDWRLIDDPSEVVKVGDKVKAKIIEISEDRVYLSLKALKKDPWKDIEKKYKKGDIVSGKVTKFNPFGAFVEITPKIQALIHISEFGQKAKMEKALEIGKKYNFKIYSIDPEEHRMTLKLVKE